MPIPGPIAGESPLVLYGSSISYFTGKLENYFRLRGIPYQFRSMQFPAMKHTLEQEVGLMQMPALQLADGRWLTDTTPIIDWFEGQVQGKPLVPDDPVLAYVCQLLEDWADEWWWRPAMHYRWHYPEGARFASRHLALELTGSIKLPLWLKSQYFKFRQRRGYTTGDGLTPGNIPAVEAQVQRLFGQLQGIFSARPFLLGDRPSLADVGLSGPFCRHFALDPVPHRMLQQRAPAILDWLDRLWHTRLDELQGEFCESLPADLEPLLEDIGSGYLPYLNANAEAVRRGERRFDADIDGVCYRGARYSRYRVWCLEQLRARFLGVDQGAQQAIRSLLEARGCWQPLWQVRDLPLLDNQEAGLPFRGCSKMIAVNEN